MRRYYLTALMLGWLLAQGSPATAGKDLAPEETEALTAPLARDDPRAQLDPAWENLPEAPVPAPGRRARGKRALRAMIQDPVTGEMREEQLERRTTVRLRRLAPGARVVQGLEGPTTDVHSAFEPNVILGSDGRVQITDTTGNPYRKIVKLRVRFPDSSTDYYGCTGALVAGKYVLTAGHCVHNRSRGGYINYAEVVPGLDGTYKPYGSAYWVNARASSGWTSDSDDDYDYGLITLDRKIGDVVGWFQMASLNEDLLKASIVRTAGYPGDMGGKEMWYDDNSGVASVSKTMVKYDMDTYDGQSGSPVYTYVYTNYYSYPTAFAVHHGSCSWYLVGTKNCGARLNSDRLKLLASWIATGK
jgi:V8-like Glu-specific endopeptidase